MTAPTQQPLIACVVDLRPGLRQPDVAAISQAVRAACYPGKLHESDRTLPWREEVEFLLRSLRQFGGSLTDAPAEVHYVGVLDTQLARRLRALNVVLKPAAVMDGRHAHANKLRMLETTTPYDVLLMLDADVIIARDFGQYVRSDVMQATPAQRKLPHMEHLDLLRTYLELPLPTTRFRVLDTGEDVLPYYNSGVIVVPKQYATKLHDTWLYFIRRILDRWDELPQEFTSTQWASYFIEEISFALAVEAAQLPVVPLPLEMNFPTHWDTPLSLPEEPLCIIHNHHRLTHLGLHESPYEEINLLFARLNESIDSDVAPRASVSALSPDNRCT